MDGNTFPRPLFVPQSIDFEALSSDVKAAIQHIIVPVYNDYVLGAASSLERSLGSSLVTMMLMGVLQQRHLGDFLHDEAAVKDPVFSQSLDRYLRLVGAQQKTITLYLRIEAIREKLDAAPLRAFRDNQQNDPKND